MSAPAIALVPTRGATVSSPPPGAESVSYPADKEHGTAGPLAGMNVAMHSGGSEGIGFAIPVDYVQTVASAPKATGHVPRAIEIVRDGKREALDVQLAARSAASCPLTRNARAASWPPSLGAIGGNSDETRTFR